MTPAWLTPRRRDLLAVSLVLVALLIPVPGLYRYQGPPMEEGFMLAFPQRILAGEVANRDFLHLYGPGSLFALAGAYQVFGDTLWTERTVGLLQHLGVVFGVFALVRPWGRKVAVVSAWLCLLVVLVPVGLTAMAWNGALAFGLWALVAALASRRRAAEAAVAARLALVAGLLAGLALSYRPDLVLAIGAAGLVALWGRPRPIAGRVAIGLAIGLVPYLVQLGLAGPGPMFEGMFLEPVFDLRAGRSLPVPPSWSAPDGYLQRAAALRTLGWPFPALDPSNQIFLWFFLALAGAATTVLTGISAVRRRPEAWRSRVLLTLGVFSVGLLPQALQRPDTAHLAWVTCVGLAVLPATLAELAEHRTRLPARARWVPGLVFLVVLVTAVIPYFSLRSWVDLASQSAGRNRFGVAMSRDGRTFYYGDRAPAVAAQELIDDLDRLAQPGDRLLVGPTDLRLTPYSDAFFYYLFPELPPATRYLEMDPGIANADDSGLADEVRSADWLILSSIWNGWEEPNESDVPGSDEPNQVVRERFCLVDAYGGDPAQDQPPRFELWQRCPGGS